MRSMGAALSRQQSECARGEIDPHMAFTYSEIRRCKTRELRKDDRLCVAEDRICLFFPRSNNQIVTAALKQKLELFLKADHLRLFDHLIILKIKQLMLM